MPISKPTVTLQIIGAADLATVQEQKVLIVGQKTSAGSATAGALNEDVSSATNEINALFGARSHAAQMVRSFKAINKKSQLDVIALDDSGTGVQATAQVVFSGTATASGSIYVSAASDKNYRVKIDIASGATATAVGASVDAAFDLLTEAPFTTGASSGTVTFTAANDGTLANTWSVFVEGAVPGISASITAWASGANDPTLTTVLDVIGSRRYQTIVWPCAYSISVLDTLLDARFNAENIVLDGVGVQTKVDTLANLKSYANFNSQSIVIIGDKAVSRTALKGSALREMPDVTAAQFAAIRSLRFTDGAALSQYLTTLATKDQFGGPALASLPYFNTSMPNLPVPLAQDEFSQDDQDELTANAISLIGPNRAFNGSILGEFVTTYKTDSAGNPDTSFKFLNTVDTASVIREVFFENLKRRYAQTRLTNGDLISGRDMANVNSIRAFCLEVYRKLAVDTLVQAGQAAEKDFLDNLVVTVDLAAGSASITAAPLLVSQLRAILGTIQVNFGG